MKNLKLLIEHNELMENIHKNESMGQRENKFHQNQQLTRVERQLEKACR